MSLYMRTWDLDLRWNNSDVVKRKLNGVLGLLFSGRQINTSARIRKNPCLTAPIRTVSCKAYGSWRGKICNSKSPRNVLSGHWLQPARKCGTELFPEQEEYADSAVVNNALKVL